MTHGAWEIVGWDDQQLPLEKSIGDAVRGMVRRRWKNNAAKMIERAWDLDPKTARNVVGNGNVSERTLTKAVRAEGWAFLVALGEELTGQSYDQYLAHIIEREAHAQRERERTRADVVRLQTRARELGHLLSRPAA
jgi:hypothetical protein